MVYIIFSRERVIIFICVKKLLEIVIGATILFASWLFVNLAIGQVVLFYGQAHYWAKSADSTNIRQVKHSSKMDLPTRDCVIIIFD